MIFIILYATYTDIYIIFIYFIHIYKKSDFAEISKTKYRDLKVILLNY